MINILINTQNRLNIFQQNVEVQPKLQEKVFTVQYISWDLR